MLLKDFLLLLQPDFLFSRLRENKWPLGENSNTHYAGTGKLLKSTVTGKLYVFKAFTYIQITQVFLYIHLHEAAFLSIYLTHQYLRLCSKLTLLYFKCRETRADLTFLKLKTL